MGWSGIWLVAVRPGETAEQAVNRGTEAWIEQDDAGLSIVPNPAAEATDLSAATDRWIDHIVGLLRRENPRFEMVEEHHDGDHRRSVVLDDPDGPVSATVYSGEVQLLPRRGWDDPPDQPGYGFFAMWRYCQLIAAEGCVAHDPDDDELVDLTLSGDEAAATYLWF
jgi:hypothetical protein